MSETSIRYYLSFTYLVASLMYAERTYCHYSWPSHNKGIYIVTGGHNGIGGHATEVFPAGRP